MTLSPDAIGQVQQLVARLQLATDVYTCESALLLLQPVSLFSYRNSLDCIGLVCCFTICSLFDGSYHKSGRFEVHPSQHGRLSQGDARAENGLSQRVELLFCRSCLRSAQRKSHCTEYRNVLCPQRIPKVASWVDLVASLCESCSALDQCHLCK